MGKLQLYFSYFKNRIFKKKEKKQIDLEDIVHEVWHTDFSNPQEARFESEEHEGYTATVSQEGVLLRLERKNVYAWTVNKFFRYKDFVLTAEVDFSAVQPDSDSQAIEVNTSSAGSCAAGFLFRYISEAAFYSLLISNHGWMRIDAVVNSTPLPLVGWTKIPDAPGSLYTVKIIVNDLNITVLINDSWIASCEDDTVQAAGKICFAGQNWGQHAKAEFALRKIGIDSKPLSVEAAHTAANAPESIPAEARLNLAQSFYAMGKNLPAIFQFKEIQKQRALNNEENLTLGRIYFAQRLFPEAIQHFEEVLATEPDNEQALAELGGLYYHTSQFKALAKFFDRVNEKMIQNSSFLSNLKGHLLHAQEKYREAADAYHHAHTLNPEQGLFVLHEANELLALGEKEQAISRYVEAGNIFLRNQAYDDLDDILLKLNSIAPEDERTLTLAGKFYYAIDNKELALVKFEDLCKAKTKDATVWYLYATLLSPTEKDAALKAFQKAASLDPDCGLYQFRLAEALFLQGKPCEKQLEKALELEPENGWIRNLLAQKALTEGDIKKAAAEILYARELLPSQPIVLANYVEVKRLSGELDSCMPLFDFESGTADPAATVDRGGAFHILANALYADGRYEDADLWYRQALKALPDNSELLTDKAENDLKLHLLNEADDNLIKALDIAPSPRIYRLVALTAAEKGDYARAELTLRRSMQDYPDNTDFLADLINLYMEMNRPQQAKEQLKLLKQKEKSERVEQLRLLLKEKFNLTLR
ncbi:tetratricopeptide repeat protein [Treponema phagedenis]|uniref:tetratricopeptide repeat protein n=1 Tax=Treponema phagedenis TaxID=162 RepID=UPI0001F64283|nr:tetratricopeptide repeat protein [Treponema phagedenis]EFW39134.1 tetratricopeptide repeat protein [Treponema phagedenis F0421]TYT77763.1 tetratricopeptide repeat protein [Treponema phagedenis]